MKFKYTLTHLQSELSNLSEHSNQLDKDVFKKEASPRNNKLEEDPNLRDDF
jgi:hypothetical protein